VIEHPEKLAPAAPRACHLLPMDVPVGAASAKPPSRLCPRQHLRADADARLEQLRVDGVVWFIGFFVGFVLWPFATVALQQATGSFALAFLTIPGFMAARVWFIVPEHAGKELNAIAVEALIATHECAPDNQVHRPAMAEPDGDNERLHRCRACFETRSASALSMRSVLDGIKKIPQPEEAAQRPSRRPQGADPA
jgi:hypothetical protein